MTTFTFITPPALLLLSLVAVFPLLIAPQRNGLMDLFQGDDAQISFFAIMVRFILPILEPGNLSLSVQALHFFAMWMSSWILILVESFRPGPKDPSKTWVYAFGLAIECVGAGVVLPVWCLLNIIYSHQPSGLRGNSSSLHSASIPSLDLKALQWSLIIGAGIPVLVMLVCPVQGPVALLSKETWIIIRIFHPITAGIVHFLLRRSVLIENGSNAASISTSESSESLRRIYRVAFWMSALSHGLIMLAIGAAYMFPLHLDSKIVDALAVRSIWPAPSPWQKWESKLQTSELGIATFLFWDEVVSSLAIILWALTVNKISHQEAKRRHTWQLVIRVVTLVLVAGPGAAAVDLIQENDDEFAQAQVRVDKKKA